MMTDTELLQASLTGNHRAYGQIVKRYKSLICAIAYGVTGDLRLSEDLAQETFVTAWRGLGEVRDTSKFRSWLCGIARNLSLLSLRKEGRDAMAHAKGLERMPEQAVTAPTPRDYAISKEEQALLWNAIEQIPEPYRVPLILYYREEQSVQRVAQSLGLSPDAVRQRLVRGRRMLKGHVESFVERSLARTRPASGFTLGVLSALPKGIPGGTGSHAALVGSRNAGTMWKLFWAGSSAGTKQLALAGIIIASVLGAGSVLRANESPSSAQPARSEKTHSTLLPESYSLAAANEHPDRASIKTALAEAAPGLSALPATSAGPVKNAVPARQVAPAGYPGVAWKESPADTIEGTVYDADGRELDGAKVSAVRYGSGALQVFECLTDAHGRYRLTVPPGQWSVKARKAFLGGEAGPEVWGQVITEGRGDTITKHIRMKQRGIIRGRILDKETGLPVTGGQVYAGHQSGDTVLVSADGDGYYELEGVGQYEHYLVALCPGYERLVLITSTVRRKEAELDIRLARAVKITGVVTDEAGRPIAHAWVGRDLLNTGNSMYHYEVCDEHGRFDYDGVPFGKRPRLTAKFPCYANLCAVYTGPEQQWEGVVPSTSEATGEAKIVLQGKPVDEACAYWRGHYPEPDGGICGRVVTTDGDPARDFRILVQWPHNYQDPEERPQISIDSWTRGFSFTAQDGEFVLGIPAMRPGHVVRVVAMAEGYGQGVCDMAPVHPLNRLPSTEALVLRLGATRELNVRVVEDISGAKPIEGAQVRILDVHPGVGDVFQWGSTQLWRSVALMTDRQGWARFANLEMTEGAVTADREGKGRARAEWRNNERKLLLVLSHACIVEGTVLDTVRSANGRPVPSGFVKLDRLPEGVYDPHNKTSECFEVTIKPEHHGEFRIEELPPGYYRLTAHWWRRPYQENVSYADEFTLEPGEVLTAVYPDDCAFNNPDRWLAEKSEDPGDEGIRESLIGTWYHDMVLSDGTIHRAVYHFADDGSSMCMKFYQGRSLALTMPGYFKVYNGSLKTVEQGRAPYDTDICFTDPGTLLLGWMSSEPPLKRAASLEQAVREGEALLAGVRPAPRAGR